MNGLPIDINASATPGDSGGSRTNRSRRDGDLRGSQFEQLLLALTSKAKSLSRGTNDSSTPQSTSKTSPVEHFDGPAADSKRYVACGDSSPAVAHEEDDHQADVEVDASSDEEAKSNEETSS